MAEVYHNNIIDIDLESGTLFRSFLNHTIGSGDNNANWYGVRVFRKGEPIALSGCSVQGLFMPASGAAILISDGTHTWVSGNEAAVLLPQACYNVKGRFTLTIKIIGTNSYSITDTVRIIDGVVADTYSENPVAPTAAVPTYQEILAVYDQMVAAKEGSVRFDIEQELTAAQMTQARGNIAAASESDVSDLDSAISDALPHEQIISFQNKTFSTVSGEITTDNPARLISELLDIAEGDTFSIDSDYEYEVFRFSRQGVYSSNPIAWTSGATEFVATSAYGSYLHRIYIRNRIDPSANITADEINLVFNIPTVEETYLNVMDAVDEKIEHVQDEIDSILEVLPTEKADLMFINNSFNINTGEIGAQNNARLLSGLLEIKEGDTFTLAEGYEYEILRFTKSGVYSSNPITWTTNSFTANSAYNNYLTRLYIRNVDTISDVNPDNIGINFTFAEYPNVLKSIDDEINDIIDERGIESAQLSIVDINELSLWENGNIGTNTGTSQESSSWLYPVSIRTKTFLPDKVYYVAVDRGWFLRGFKYKADGTFIEWISGNNITECFLSPQMKYRFQLIKEGADPNKQSTHISVADDSYTHVHFFEIKNAPSSFYKYLDFGVMQYDKYYTGLQNAYDINKNISYADFMTAWNALITNYAGYATRTDLGAASDNQHLYLFDFNPAQINIDAHSALIAGSAESVPVLPTIIITVCQHGNEKAAGFGAYYFIKDLLENWYGNGLLSYIRHHMRLLIIPVCNPYGWDNNLGVNANGVNINRNFPYNFVPGGGSPGDQEYAGLAALDQPESTIIYNLVCDHANAFHLCDFHTTGNTAPAVNEVAWLSYFETDDLYYNRIVNYARVYLKTFSANLIKEYELSYSEDTILAMMIGGKGNGVLKNWASSLNIIGTTLESTGEIYGSSEYHTPRSMKYSSELLGNWLGVVIEAYNKTIN